MQPFIDVLGDSFQFFDAVDAQSGAHEPFKKAHYSKRRALLSKGRELSEGEIACWASNYSLWKKCVELNEPIVVLEDDVAMVDDSFAQTLSLIEASGHQYVRLAATNLRKANARKLDANFIEFLGNPSGAQGYYLTPSAAQKFIKHAQTVFFSQDDYMDSYFIHGVRNVGIWPFAVKESSEQQQSTIANAQNHKKRKSSFFKFTSEIYRSIVSCKKRLYLASHKHYSKVKRLPKVNLGNG